MRYPDDGRFEAKGFGLRRRARFEFDRGDAATGDAAFIEGCAVMQTARRARPSIGETDNGHITAFDHLLDDRFGRGPRIRRFPEAEHIQALIR